MEETIYKILESKVKLLTYTSREAYTKEAAEEISEHVFEFLAWIKYNCTTTKLGNDTFWSYTTINGWPEGCNKSSALYDYWLKNIRNG